MLYLPGEEKIKFDPSAFMKVLMLITVIITVSVVLIMLFGRDYLVKKEKAYEVEEYPSNDNVTDDAATIKRNIPLPSN